ncbi:hypothetical protein G9A89_010944 [Geosiphon pyriformis]|nr:hypothetical protein G9A89_010944 [Geosiphon pyriformis]
MDIFKNLPSNAQQLVKIFEDYTVAVDELLATENILDNNEIVDMVLADAQIETNTINDSEEELEESPPALITITEAYEALKKFPPSKSLIRNLERGFSACFIIKGCESMITFEFCRISLNKSALLHKDHSFMRQYLVRV